MNIKTKGQPQWFDNGIRDMKKMKENLRLRAKSQNATQDDITRFELYKVQYKHRVNNKKKDFITKVDPCENENTIINKRFWSHIKNKSNCSRIPDSVHYNGRFRTNTGDKCELFNSFFCAQFSEASSYNININQLSNSIYDLDLCPGDVYNILKNVDPSKTSGPDGIDGYVLKSC